MHLTSHVTAGNDGDARGTAARHRPAVPVPAARPRCQVPRLFGSLPTCRARVPRRARPGGLAGPHKGRAAGGPASPGQRKAPRPCPAPHQPGHRPNNRPPLPPPPNPPAAQMRAGKGMTARAGKEKRPGKTGEGNSPGIMGMFRGLSAIIEMKPKGLAEDESPVQDPAGRDRRQSRREKK